MIKRTYDIRLRNAIASSGAPDLFPEFAESEAPNGMAGAVVFIQRFGSGANVNVLLHIIALDGTYREKCTGRVKFTNAKAPTEESVKRLVTNIAGK